MTLILNKYYVEKPLEELQVKRCYSCTNKLFLFFGNLDIEVICSGCRKINYTGESSVGLRGQSFMSQSIDHHCIKCQRLLFRSIGEGFVEGYCKHCGLGTLFDTSLMRQKHIEFKIKLDDKHLKIQQSLAR